MLLEFAITDVEKLDPTQSDSAVLSMLEILGTDPTDKLIMDEEVGVPHALLTLT